MSGPPAGRYNLATRFAGGVGGHFVGGEWRADTNRNVIAAITNIGSKPTSALLTLHYDNGGKSYEMQQTVQPGDQMWVNLTQLIRQRVPDRKGNTLPVDVASVTYDVRDLTPGGLGLMANALEVDSTLGVQAVPNHLSCCGDGDAGWDPGAFDLVIDGTEFGTIQGIDQCTGQLQDIIGDFTSWSSANPAIAKVTTGKVQGLAVGTTTGSASGYVTVGNGSYCTVVPEDVYAPITVGPFVQTVSPDSGAQGQTVTPVTITGLGFGTAPVITGDSSINVGPITVNPGGTQITTSFGVLTSAIAGTHTLTLYNTNGGSDGGSCTPGQNCPYAQFDWTVTQATPTSETTKFYGFDANNNTEAAFQMTLNPSQFSYDGNTVREDEYQTGTDTCYWSGASGTLQQPPTVNGDSWTVGTNPPGHNGYGLDEIGFPPGAVAYIRQHGPQNGITLPCTVTLYQQMSFNGTPYQQNVDTQTIAATTVTVCRAGVCATVTH